MQNTARSEVFLPPSGSVGGFLTSVVMRGMYGENLNSLGGGTENLRSAGSSLYITQVWFVVPESMNTKKMSYI